MFRFFITFIFLFWITESYGGTLSGKAKVLDGDTIMIDGQTIDLRGIDAPEKEQKCNNPGGSTWPCGYEAIKVLQDLIEERMVVCKYKGRVQDTQVSGDCFVQGIISVNATMVRKGYAWVDAKMTGNIIHAEQRAKREKKGIWRAPTKTAREYNLLE